MLLAADLPTSAVRCWAKVVSTFRKTPSMGRVQMTVNFLLGSTCRLVPQKRNVIRMSDVFLGSKEGMTCLTRWVYA